MHAGLQLTRLFPALFDDAEAAHDEVMAPGATLFRPAAGPADDFQVYADPAGHSFCICWVITQERRPVRTSRPSECRPEVRPLLVDSKTADT